MPVAADVSKTDKVSYSPVFPVVHRYMLDIQLHGKCPGKLVLTTFILIQLVRGVHLGVGSTSWLTIIPF